MNEAGPVAPRKVLKNVRQLDDVVQEYRDWWLVFERALAGHVHLKAALETFTASQTGKSAESAADHGGRRKGLPLFTFPASPDGRTKVDVVANVAHVNPEHVPHVLIPLINMFQLQVVEALGELQHRHTELLQLLQPTPAETRTGGPSLS